MEPMQSIRLKVKAHIGWLKTLVELNLYLVSAH
jgi:hypothetical protein